MAINSLIKRCARNHYFIEKVCPWCGGGIVETYRYREGDCVACGFLCSAHAYGCCSPEPIQIFRIKSWLNDFSSH